MGEAVSLISVVASVLSAVGGAFACVAAFRSAGHAKEAFNDSQKAEKRFALRQLSLTAHQVCAEVDRIKWVAQGLKAAYQTLAVFSGVSEGSRVILYDKEIDEKIKLADALVGKARPFIEFQKALLNGPLDEISGREIAMSQHLVGAMALREEIEIELSEVQVQNAVHREMAIKNAKGNSS